MENQRKRKPETVVASGHQKRVKLLSGMPVRRDLLERHYGRVTSLREYVLSKLPRGSRLRRKKVASISEADDAGENEKTLSRLLDTSIVCFAHQEADNDDTRWEQWLAFSQREDESYVSLSDGIARSIFSQNEVSVASLFVWQTAYSHIDCRFCCMASLLQGCASRTTTQAPIV
jgi:telomerase reverse transcriptase